MYGEKIKTSVYYNRDDDTYLFVETGPKYKTKKKDLKTRFGSCPLYLYDNVHEYIILGGKREFADYISRFITYDLEIDVEWKIKKGDLSSLHYFSMWMNNETKLTLMNM